MSLVDLYIITLPNACCSVDVNENGFIVDAAPIMRWSVGRHINPITEWVSGKGGRVSRPSTTKYEAKVSDGSTNPGTAKTGRVNSQARRPGRKEENSARHRS